VAQTRSWLFEVVVGLNPKRVKALVEENETLVLMSSVMPRKEGGRGGTEGDLI
jgi:hypothetical protein